MPQAVARNLEGRELTDQDYELFLQLEARSKEAANSTNSAADSLLQRQIPERVIKSWASEKVRENSPLLNPGVQCRVCLRSFMLGQLVRKLPNCKHKFHADCIDNWLLHSHPTCPIDGQVVWDPITAQLEKEQQKEYDPNLVTKSTNNSSKLHSSSSSSSSSTVLVAKNKYDQNLKFWDNFY